MILETNRLAKNGSWRQNLGSETPAIVFLIIEASRLRRIKILTLKGVTDEPIGDRTKNEASGTKTQPGSATRPPSDAGVGPSTVFGQSKTPRDHSDRETGGG
jgi:hypothetical protein